MEQKPKKKLFIILAVIAVILIAGLSTGYIVINKMFSAFSDSFYQSAAPPSASAEAGGDEVQATPQPPEEQEPAQPSLPQNLSKEQAQEMIDAISFNDKLAVMNILSKSLSAAEYKEMLGMLSGGITAEEMKRAKTILNERLSGDDRQKILDYYAKYSSLLE